MEELLAKAMKYKENKKICVIVVEDIKCDLITLEGHLLNMSKIPNVIGISKKYNNFEININQEIKEKAIDNYKVKFNKEPTQLILLKESGMMLSKRYYVFNAELSINFNYFTHTDIFRMFLPDETQISAYEIIGDIIHVNLNDKQVKYGEFIGKILNLKTDKTVVNKTDKINNMHRNYELEILAGGDKLTTVHIEDNIKYYIDLNKVYWCSRLQGERKILANSIKNNQSVCDPFCGVGPNILPLVKKGCKIYANDINKDAIDCLRRSIELNKFDLNQFIIDCGSSEVFLSKIIDHHIDHFIFNLPELSLLFVKYLESFSDFTLHAYFFYKDGGDVVKYTSDILNTVISDKHIRMVRNVSPSKNVYILEISDKELFKR